jgi:sugar phosphate isomerase/epimerase
MRVTRRDFGKLAAAYGAQLALAGGIGTRAMLAMAPGKPNSVVSGVRLGVQPFCYHDLAMNPDNRSLLIQAMLQNGISIVELHATWVEPRFAAPGVDPEVARQKQYEWRMSTPPSFYAGIKKEFDDVGIEIFTYYVNFNMTTPTDEIEKVFEAARLLGAKGAIGSYGQAVALRIYPYAAKHGVFVGLHNHDNLSDPDSFSNEASFDKVLPVSPAFKATLDVRHFTAGNGDSIGFLQRHHERVSSVHLGDRRRNNGRSTPFGQGDAPIIEILRLIRDNQWPITALLEFEHGTLRTGIEEVQVQLDYCKRALA